MEGRLARAKQCVHDCKLALRDAERIYAELLSIDEDALSPGAAELIDLYGPGTILMAYETGRLMYEKSVVPVPLERLKVKVSLSGTAGADTLERLSIDIASLLNREIQLQVKRDIAAKDAEILVRMCDSEPGCPNPSYGTGILLLMPGGCCKLGRSALLTWVFRRLWIVKRLWYC